MRKNKPVPSYEITQDKKFFYTKGLKELLGYELVMWLDVPSKHNSHKLSAMYWFNGVRGYFANRQIKIEPYKTYYSLFTQKRKHIEEGCIEVIRERDLITELKNYKGEEYILIKFVRPKSRSIL